MTGASEGPAEVDEGRDGGNVALRKGRDGVLKQNWYVRGQGIA